MTKKTALAISRKERNFDGDVCHYENRRIYFG